MNDERYDALDRARGFGRCTDGHQLKPMDDAPGSGFLVCERCGSEFWAEEDEDA
ncbi:MULTISPECIES: hypothetical protein [Tomitella]|uniref:Uncharacterized protein n=1 Tax=Tomitella cavernea TaxID=1387982 RepID=A0ABP9CFN0_9ACTN|nr:MULTISPECIES: hypothetical protein [Tomitella]